MKRLYGASAAFGLTPAAALAGPAQALDERSAGSRRAGGIVFVSDRDSPYLGVAGRAIRCLRPRRRSVPSPDRRVPPGYAHLDTHGDRVRAGLLTRRIENRFSQQPRRGRLRYLCDAAPTGERR